MKKGTIFLAFLLMALSLSVANANVGYDITNKDYSGTYAGVLGC